MPMARRAPPPPPSGSEECPPPLPSRHTANSRSPAAASEPPPLPSRPTASSGRAFPPIPPTGGSGRHAQPPVRQPQPSDDMYEDMNGGGGAPQIIDARPINRKPPQAVLPAGLNSSVNSRQTEDLMMDETYELPVANAQIDVPTNKALPNLPPRPQQRLEKQGVDDDSSEGWSDSEFDDVRTSLAETLESPLKRVDDFDPPAEDETYEMPDGQHPAPVMDDVYEQADEAFDKCQPVPLTKKPFGASANTITGINPATLQMSKLKLSTVSSQEPIQPTPTSHAIKQIIQQLKPPETKNDKPKPPPKPRSNQAAGGTSIVKALKDMLQAREKGISNSNESKESTSDDNASAGSVSSQPVAKPVAQEEKKPPSLPSSKPPPHAERPTLNPKPVPAPPSKPQPSPVWPKDESDLIYDEAMSEPMFQYDWYHGPIDRRMAEDRMKSLIRENGAFLIRDSSQSKAKSKIPNHRYTLVIVLNQKVHNLIIRYREDHGLALGKEEKPDEMTFASLEELVEFHRKSNVVLIKEGASITLASSPQRP